MSNYNSPSRQHSMHRALLAGAGAGTALTALYLGGPIAVLPVLSLSCAAIYLRLTRNSQHGCCN